MSDERLRKYETVVVTRNDAGYGAQHKFHEKLTELMEETGVRPIRFEFWGKRRLAYQIEKASKGLYHYHLYLGEGEFLKAMNRMLKLSGIVLRYMTVKLDDDIDPETYDFETEQHFDTLPSESDERKDRDRPMTGWEAEFNSGEAKPKPAEGAPADKKPAAEEAPADEAKPDTEEAPAVEAEPDAEEAPAAEAKPDTEEKPAVEEKEESKENDGADAGGEE